MSREMLVNVAESEECRVAVIEGGTLEELYIERASLGSIVGNVYKGKVVNIEAGIQAAFVDLGTGRNGFLHISDLHPRYFPGNKSDLVESVGRRQSLKDRPPLQDCLRKGNEIVVQVTKEGLKTKGPTLSTYLALPGKYIVMMPWMRKHGVSQKIEDEDERKRLKTILDESGPPKEVGCIIRTAGDGCAKRDLQSDLRYLTRMWNDIQKRMESSKAPVELFQESDLVIRALRDIFNNKIKNIICDSEPMVRKIKDFLSHAYPRMKRIVTSYDGGIPLFHKYHIESEIEKIQSRSVALRSGGSIVIEQTEALVAIDVNSGRHHGMANAEQTALETNLEAAVEIARQLRLRDLGGLIICDFIDMRQQKNRKEVERVFRTEIKKDRARSKTLAISRFGVVEMTRQRMRSSLQSSIYLTCPHCAGLGYVKSHESLAIEVIRLLNLAASHDSIRRIELSVSPEVAAYLQNEKRTSLSQIEQESEKRIIIHAVPDYAAGKHEMVCYNARGSVIRVEEMVSHRQTSRRHPTDNGSSKTNGSGRRGRSGNGNGKSSTARMDAKSAAIQKPEGEAPEEVNGSDRNGAGQASADSETSQTERPSKKRGRSRRRRGKPTHTEETKQVTPGTEESKEIPSESTEGQESSTVETQGEQEKDEVKAQVPAKKRGRSRRRRSKPAATEETRAVSSEQEDKSPAPTEERDQGEASVEEGQDKESNEKKEEKVAPAKKRGRSRRRRSKPASSSTGEASKPTVATEVTVTETADVSDSAKPVAEGKEGHAEEAKASPPKRGRSRRRRPKVASVAEVSAKSDESSTEAPVKKEEAKVESKEATSSPPASEETADAKPAAKSKKHGRPRRRRSKKTTVKKDEASKDKASETSGSQEGASNE